VYLRGHAVTGFATVILLLLIVGSFLMISLGIIGEYVAKIYDEVKGRPRYVVAEKMEPAFQNISRDPHSRDRNEIVL
jgi:dolichol-phosphate mannosyltransferase